MNWQPIILNVTPQPTGPFVVLSIDIVCDKVTEE